MELAAIATAAVPGLSPTGVAGMADDADDFDSALIVDDRRNRWRVRSPRHEEASMRLETELAALRSFTPGIRAGLPFLLPSVAGTVRQGSLRTFVYNHVPGSLYDLESLVALGGRTAGDLGKVMAAIHGLPPSVVDRADLPSYTANEFRQRKLNELDQAATTGRIPPRLLRRWEHALEDAALWRFNPTVVHGDLHEDHMLLEDGRITAVTGWTDLRIGDPADDFAWLAAAHEQSFADAVLEAYVGVRGEQADPHIMRRAALAAEFALAQWLVKGLLTSDEERTAEAEQMLRELDEDIAEFGGQPISIVEPPRPPRPEDGAGLFDEAAEGPGDGPGVPAVEGADTGAAAGDDGGAAAGDDGDGDGDAETDGAVILEKDVPAPEKDVPAPGRSSEPAGRVIELRPGAGPKGSAASGTGGSGTGRSGAAGTGADGADAAGLDAAGSDAAGSDAGGSGTHGAEEDTSALPVIEINPRGRA
ncbi:hypothetical protein NCCP1664_03380 [Zafaria cholistanensis]|uniref:Aminoglycoside phosphotransferase domain-containing protein n=2 Tax=Zafaria cholistanensis TaxID=1682741 RepID=A0A5A7NPZ7_9MICC|nr:hypothetical protein NCCP1664_03380 [Zafaria cholistanensis]